tara:strand:+ start:457 stop:1110 length:654 start_codon:yes stop_codon:yes gene_type:complete
MIIAIDGPAGSGKSTTAKLLANKLDFIYLDTGAMYRAVTLYFLNNNIDLNDLNLINNFLHNMDLKLFYNDNRFKVILNNEDITHSLRNQDINKNVSQVSKNINVRKKMVDIQRNFSKNKDIVVEGRDIGTHVFPNAEYKFFIEADIRVRVKRRYNEMADKSNISLSELENQIKNRDLLDSKRAISPLIKSNDAIVIDTTKLTIDEQVKKIYNLITNN